MILLQSCNIKIMFQVKVAILKYIETLTLQMEPQDFVNSSETRLAVSRIITWTTEPKSSDVRKVLDIICSLHERDFKCFCIFSFTFWALFIYSVFLVLLKQGWLVWRTNHVLWLQAAQSVLISLFQLNTPEFTMLLAALPKTFQDGATKLLQNHLRNTGNTAQVIYLTSLKV